MGADRGVRAGILGTSGGSGDPEPRRGLRGPQAGLAAILAAVLAAAGCNTAPAGDTGGLIPVSERTGADRFDPAADSVTLLEFADASGQELSAAFLTLPTIAQSQFRVVIEVGSIQNNTATPSSDFAAVQRRVFLTLAQSDLVRKGARVVETRARVSRDVANANDPFGQGDPGSVTGLDQYPLGSTYFLQGTFSELSRGGAFQSTYLFDVTLTNAQTREIVYAKQIVAKQLR